MLKEKVLLIGMATVVCLLAGCGKDAEVVEPETVMGETAVEEADVEEETEQIVEEETVVEEPEEVVPTMEERLTELGLQGICLVVWNDSTGTEHVIENGESYEEQKDDRFFICTPSKMSAMDFFSTSGTDLGETSSNYYEIIFGEFEENNIVELAISCKNGEEEKINFTMTSSQKPIQPGYEWVQALGYEEPKIVVWNDITGLRKELEEGETYQLSQGDEVSMYVPDGNVFNDANIGQENVERSINIATAQLENVTFEESLNLEMSIMNDDTGNITKLSVTLLPPTE